MAKLGKFNKLKSTLKSSFRKLGHTSSIAPRSDQSSSTTVDSLDEQSIPALGFQTVYVGKSRRAYQISSQVIEHPSFQGLINRSDLDGCDDNVDTTIMISCEVVLFEHLLWMLESVDPETESLDDLVSLYA